MSDQAIREVIYRSALALDAEAFDDFMALCGPEFDYRITAFSPEIRKEMTWLEHDRGGLASMFAMVPQHLKRLGSLKRHVSVYTVERRADAGSALATSSVLVIHTDPDGRSKLFAAGTYFDEIDCSGPHPLLRTRRVQLETRDLGIGSHIPL